MKTFIAICTLSMSLFLPWRIEAATTHNATANSDTALSHIPWQFPIECLKESTETDIAIGPIDTSKHETVSFGKLTLYDYPYSRTLSIPNWRRLWTNTGVLMGGGVATLLILQALPDDATAWNRASRREIPLFRRYVDHIKAGPVWDGDKFIFNYVLHPYGGGAYYMSARSCGFNCWGSFLYCFCISTFFWEYGFEAFNETPSVQDLVITPVVGSLMGEAFYLAKRYIVRNEYRLLGSKILGYFAAFILDPVNEVVGYFRGDQRKASIRQAISKPHNGPSISGSPWVSPSRNGLSVGFSVSCSF